MKSHEVLLLISTMPPQRFEGVARLASECGWHLMIENRKSPPEEWCGDGILVMLRNDPVLLRFIRRMRRRRIPVVDLIGECPGVALPRVTGDNREIGRLAAQHFLERDFHHAAFFSLEHSPVHDIRFSAFEETWTRSKPLRLVWPEAAGGHVRNWAKMEAWLGERLREAPKPLAVFAWNDYDATHVLSTCRREGLRVPEDVAILGVDDNRLLCEHQATPLSSVIHNHERISYAGAALLERLMSGKRASARPIEVKPSGIAVRASTDLFAVNDPEVKPAVDYIEENLAHPLGAAQVASAIGLPRLRLDRLFASRLGRSVGAEILRRRLRLAESLLSKSSEPLEQIASDCGFCNASFLIRTFKKAKGMTPTAWRREHAS